MSDHERVQDLLQRSATPALHFDLDETMRLGRRARRRRRAALVGGAAAGVAAFGFAVAAALPLGGSPLPPAGPSSSARPTSPQPTTPSSTPSEPIARATSNPGRFGSRSTLRPPGTDLVLSVHGVESAGRRFASLLDHSDGPGYGRTLSGLLLDVSDPPADIAIASGPMAVLLSGQPLGQVRLGPDGPELTSLTSAPVAGTERWVTVGILPTTWTEPWPDLYWQDRAGASGRSSAPQSAVSTVPAKAGPAGWNAIPVRFTARPSAGGALVAVEHEAAGRGMVPAADVALAPGEQQTFVRGDGANYAALYGLTRSRPVAVTPHGNPASRFAGGWTFTTVELAEGLWATAVQLTGMDDSSVQPITSVSWKDAAGVSHTFSLR